MRKIDVPIVAVVLVILVASIQDAYMTLGLLDHETVREINPLMAWALSIGDGYFVALKTLLTLTGALGLVALRAYRRKLALCLGIALSIGYFGVIWHEFEIENLVDASDTSSVSSGATSGGGNMVASREGRRAD